VRAKQPEEIAAFETVHVAVDWCYIGGRELAGLPDNTPGSYTTERFAAGQVLPETVRPDVLAHLVTVGLAVPIHVPVVTTSTRSNRA
jgi:hypothetical protein